VNALVDTSIWSLAFRRKAEDLSARERLLVGELTELVRDGRARVLGLVRQELLTGINSQAQFERLRQTLAAFPDEPVSTADFEAAAKASNQCLADGTAVSVVDMLLCAVAQRRGMSIFSTDADFVRYARVLPLKLHLVAPRRIIP